MPRFKVSNYHFISLIISVPSDIYYHHPLYCHPLTMQNNVLALHYWQCVCWGAQVLLPSDLTECHDDNGRNLQIYCFSVKLLRPSNSSAQTMLLLLRCSLYQVLLMSPSNTTPAAHWHNWYNTNVALRSITTTAISVALSVTSIILYELTHHDNLLPLKFLI